MATKTERMEVRTTSDIKTLAERASSLSNLSVSDYIAKLVKEDAPETIEKESRILLSQKHFDKFIKICKKVKPISKKIKAAAKRLDDEGF